MTILRKVEFFGTIIQIFCFTFILVTVIIPTNSSRKSSDTIIIIQNANVSYNPKKFEFLNCFVGPDSNRSSFSLTANMLDDIQSEAHVAINFLVKIQPSNSYKTVFRYDFDMCKLFQGFMRKSIARTWYRHLKRFSNFPSTCPISRGYYYIKDMTINPVTIPPFIQHGQYMINNTFYVKRGSINDWYANSTMYVDIASRQ